MIWFLFHITARQIHITNRFGFDAVERNTGSRKLAIERASLWRTGRDGTLASHQEIWYGWSPGCQIKFDAAPPYLDSQDPRFPGNQPGYTGINKDELPLGESMQQTLARFQPYWRETIQPEIQQGRRILIVSHSNLRTLMMLFG